VWGNYVTWRRAVNQNENKCIELSEPSWIMVHNLESGKTWNISRKLTIIRDTIYYHAEAPAIWNGKIIYESQINGNSTDTKLFMYNISSKNTWQIPIRSSENAHGHLHGIYDNWIVYTDIQNSKRQAYLYNYNDGTYRTIVSKSDPYSVYGFVMNGNYVILTIIDTKSQFNLWIYNLNTANINVVNCSNINCSQIIATSIYGNRVGVTALVQSENLTHWQTYTLTPSTGELRQEQKDAHGLLIWDEQEVYEVGQDIHILNTETNNVTVLSSKTQRLGDIYGNTLVWTDNSNSLTLYGDARDDFDVYVRTVITTEQVVIDSMYIIIPVVVLIAAVIIAKRESLRNKT